MTAGRIRSEPIDLLRGFSILVVLLLHFHVAYDLFHGYFGPLLFVKFMRGLSRNGNYGVTIFFVVSGFLITSMSLSRFGQLRDVSLRAFYSFRFARIFPNLALVLAVVVPLGLGGVRFFANNPGTASMGTTVFCILTFTHNLLLEKFGYFNWCLNVLWSLSVEEMFYFTFPLFCVLLRKDALLLGFWAIFVVVGPIHRLHYANHEMVALYGYASCFDGIAIGCIAALLRERLHLSADLKFLTRGLAIVMLAGVYLYKPILANVVFGVSLIALSAGTILMGLPLSGQIGNSVWGTVTSPLRWLGRNSYELYLFHAIILAFMNSLVPWGSMRYGTKLLWLVLYIVFSALVAEFISRLYSQPMNQLLRTLLAPTGDSSGLQPTPVTVSPQLD
jgi:peptidoglycan/LPS O-acetylase OafA/YrhL